MSYCLLDLAIILLGCGSTQVIEKTLEAEAVADVNEHCAVTCKASVSYVENLELQAYQDAESVYQRLVDKDLTITLRDSTVLQSRLSGFRPLDVWFMSRLDQQGKHVGTVQFPYASVDGIGVSDARGNGVEHLVVRNERALQVDGNRARLDSGKSIPLDSLHEVRFVQTQRRRGLGGFIGLLAGAGIGAVVGSATGGDSIAGRGGAALVGAVRAAPVGGLLGIMVGAPKTTIYRFRPDTPQQMSFVIGVGPTNRGAR